MLPKETVYVGFDNHTLWGKLTESYIKNHLDYVMKKGINEKLKRLIFKKTGS